MWETQDVPVGSRDSAPNTPLLLFSRSVVSDSATPQTVAHQGPPAMGFSRQEYWSGLLFPSPEDLLDPRTEPMSLVSAALADRFFATGTTWGTPNEVRGEGKSWGVF